MNSTIKNLDPHTKLEVLSALSQAVCLYICFDPNWTIRDVIKEHHPSLFTLDENLTVALVELDELTSSEVLKVISELALDLSSVSFDEEES
jgi:hypothetical protein